MKILFLPACLMAIIACTGCKDVFADVYDCHAHAEHIKSVIGSETAIEVYQIFYNGDDDTHHIVDTVEEEHPDIEQDLEAFVEHHCAGELLQDHAHH